MKSETSSTKKTTAKKPAAKKTTAVSAKTAAKKTAAASNKTTAAKKNAAAKKTTAANTTTSKTPAVSKPQVSEVKETTSVSVPEASQTSATSAVTTEEEKKKIKFFFLLATIIGSAVFAFGSFALFFNFSRETGIAGKIVRIILIPALIYLWPSLALCFPKVAKKKSFIVGLCYYLVLFGVFGFLGMKV